ncbi:MAG: CYTH domain-containing protein [Lachnospiraceae bacterium]|nr:CYTH domain-containing protein [Lachnospiraceae bacterium]
MEIERKFLIEKSKIPADLEQYPHNVIEQAYIITDPVLRIRKKNDAYILTYKGAGYMQREEVEFPLTMEAYNKLLTKTEGNIITKTRYKIPEHDNLIIEFDIFSGIYEGLYLAEVEFPDLKTADSYNPPEWFGKEVTHTSSFHNSTLSRLSKTEAKELIDSLP